VVVLRIPCDPFEGADRAQADFKRLRVVELVDRLGEAIGDLALSVPSVATISVTFQRISVRQHAAWKEEPQEQERKDQSDSKPALDIQAILTVLGRRTRFGKGEATAARVARAARGSVIHLPSHPAGHGGHVHPAQPAITLRDVARLCDPRYAAEPKFEGQLAQVYVAGQRTLAALQPAGSGPLAPPGPPLDLPCPVAGQETRR
jgi:hypothetical protein